MKLSHSSVIPIGSLRYTFSSVTALTPLMTADGQPSREQMYQHVQLKHVKSLTGLIRATPTIITMVEKRSKIKNCTSFFSNF